MVEVSLTKSYNFDRITNTFVIFGRIRCYKGEKEPNQIWDELEQRVAGYKIVD